MIKLKIIGIKFCWDDTTGKSHIIMPDEDDIIEDNPRIAFIMFLQRVESKLLNRFLDALEKYGYNRYTGEKENEHKGT